MAQVKIEQVANNFYSLADATLGVVLLDVATLDEFLDVVDSAVLLDAVFLMNDSDALRVGVLDVQDVHYCCRRCCVKAHTFYFDALCLDVPQLLVDALVAFHEYVLAFQDVQDVL